MESSCLNRQRVISRLHMVHRNTGVKMSVLMEAELMYPLIMQEMTRKMVWILM